MNTIYIHVIRVSHRARDSPVKSELNKDKKYDRRDDAAYLCEEMMPDKVTVKIVLYMRSDFIEGVYHNPFYHHSHTPCHEKDQCGI